jgi:hypothetical protein
MLPVAMRSPACGSAASTAWRSGAAPLRVAFLGSQVWLDGATPPRAVGPLHPGRFAALGPDHASLLPALHAFDPHVSVVFDAFATPAEVLAELPGTTLGIVTENLPEEGVPGIEALDRLVSFRPSLTGVRRAGAEVWRAIPPPVSDDLYGPVRRLAGTPRAMSIGRFTERREAMLMPAKHHHDLLQVIHGVSGDALAELLALHDVGVHVASVPGAGFAPQAGIHLAAGQLLLSEPLEPAHGLEIDIDYLQFDSADGLVWALDRLARFPEMHQRVRVRGRLKAEQYRASRLFSRLLHDLLADVAAFGSG